MNIEELREAAFAHNEKVARAKNGYSFKIADDNYRPGIVIAIITDGDDAYYCAYYDACAYQSRSIGIITDPNLPEGVGMLECVKIPQTLDGIQRLIDAQLIEVSGKAVAALH